MFYHLAAAVLGAASLKPIGTADRHSVWLLSIVDTLRIWLQIVDYAGWISLKNQFHWYQILETEVNSRGMKINAWPIPPIHFVTFRKLHPTHCCALLCNQNWRHFIKNFNSRRRETTSSLVCDLFYTSEFKLFSYGLKGPKLIWKSLSRRG